MPEEKLIAEETHIRCKVIIEILGKPKEHVEKTLRMYAGKIKNDSGFIVIDLEFSESVEKENLWSMFAELELVVKGLPKLIAFCFDYMPSSVEIIKPEEFTTKKSTVENMLNDLQSRLHNVDMIVKQQKNENEFLRKNMNTAVKNIILISLASGSLDGENLSRVTGVADKELKLFLGELAKENKIREENGSYSLVV